jgi:AcrR family transcriptional regulator
MPRISKEESDARRDQVIDACAELYRTRGYHDITMAQIAEGVTFGRANIYNYFQNKDEVFLALLRREHELWAADLSALGQAAAGDPPAFDDAELSQALAASLEPRTAMLKLLATSIFDMEQFSRHERLVELKLAYKAVLASLRSLLRAARPSWDEARIERFVFSFMPYLHGVYPYAFHSKKQLAAMREAGVPDPDRAVTDLVASCALKLLQED